jgi:hypothetical protein
MQNHSRIMREPDCFERQRLRRDHQARIERRGLVKPGVPGVGTGPILRIVENRAHSCCARAQQGISQRLAGPQRHRSGVARLGTDGNHRSFRHRQKHADPLHQPAGAADLGRNGRIWTSTAEGVQCYDFDGSLIGKILIPEMVANVTFGGAKLNRLFICGTTSLYSIYVTANGSKLG